MSANKFYVKRPSEGKIKSGSNSLPRVGNLYQAVIQQNLSESKQIDSSKLSGTPLFLASKLPSNVIDDYLNFVKSIFSSILYFDESRALFFLHNLNYNVETAKNLIQLEVENFAKLISNKEKELSDENDDYNEDNCLICNDGGKLICCDYPNCSKSYHLKCISLDSVPVGNWECPRHYCVYCKTAATHQCIYCTIGYCDMHLPEELVETFFSDEIDKDFLCFNCSIQRDSTQRGFLSRLFNFMKKKGTPILKIPKVGRRELDLFTFYNEVIKFGGINNIIKSGKWDIIRSALGFTCTSTEPLLDYYMKLLYPYERQFFSGSTAVDLRKDFKNNPLTKRKTPDKADSDEDTQSENDN